MTQDLRAKLAAATRLAEGATTPGERDAAQSVIKRLKKAMKRTGEDRPFQAPPVAPQEPVDWHERSARAERFAYTGTAEGFQQAWDEFLHGRRPAPKRPGPVKFPKADNAAYPKAYCRK